MQRADNIRIVIKPGMLNRRPNTCSSSDVRDRVYFFAAKHTSHRFALSKIDVANGYLFCETGDVCVLDLRIVEIIEIVEDNDFVPGGEQPLDKMRADKASAACDQDSHGAKLATDGHRWTQILQLCDYCRASASDAWRFTETPYNSKIAPVQQQINPV